MSWTIKKVECWRIDAFELWCWRRLLTIPWTAKMINPKGNQSWIFIGRTDAEAEAPVLWHLMWRDDSLEKTMMWGKIEGKRRRGWQRMRWFNGTTDSMDIEFEQTPGDSEGQGSLVSCSSEVHSQTGLSDWTARFTFQDDTGFTSQMHQKVYIESEFTFQ